MSGLLLHAYNTSSNHSHDTKPISSAKRPFVVDSHAKLLKVLDVFSSIATETEPFSIKYEGIQNFGSKVLFLKVSANKHLGLLHERLVEAMLLIDPYSKLSTECTSEMIFHTTLSLELGVRPVRSQVACG